MKQSKRNSGIAAAVVAIAGAVAFPAAVLQASPAQAAGCGPFANTPSFSSGQVGGFGGRKGCSSSTVVTVCVKWDRSFHSDPCLTNSQRSGTYVNVSFYVEGTCVGGAHDYYVDSNGTDSNPRLRVTC
jgi:hypothetical protein